MPGLVVFRRRWGIGSDDLVFPSIAEIIVRVAWLIAITIIYELHHESMKLCEHGYLLRIYLVGMIVLVLIVIALNGAIFIISLRGTIMNPEPRKQMPIFLFIRALVIFPEIIWNVVGTYWVFGSTLNCSEDVISTVKITVICGWTLLWMMMIAIALIFDPLGNEIYNQGSHVNIPLVSRQSAEILDRGSQNTWSHQVWELRCRIMCCCTPDVNQEVYRDLAKTLSLFFQDVDLVPSDVAAGLVLLHQQEKTNVWDQVSSTVLNQATADIPNESDIDTKIEQKPNAWKFWMTPEMADHYIKFAFACYGWPLFLIGNCMTGLCELYKHMRCCGCLCRKPNYIIDDNCCQCNTSALKQTTGLSDEDLIYVSFHNRIFEVPFYVAIDHQTCAIVISIRGTLSLPDALTDLTIDCVPLNVAELPSNLAAHKGMFAAAKFVQDRLVETNALNNALGLHQSYTLVITGHSLGAGIAAILAILLKPSHPNLRCFCYSPPAALLSRETAKFSEDFVFSIIIGYDMVARLNYSTMEELKRSLIRTLYNCHSPKYRILINQCFDCCFGLGTQYEWSRASTPGQALPLLHEEAGTQNATYESLADIVHYHPVACVPHMYLPGLILHIESTSEVDSNEQPMFSSTWHNPEYFDRLIVTPQMLSDHTPHAVARALQCFVRQGPHYYTGVHVG